MKNKYLEVSTELNFMNLVIDVQGLFDLGFTSDWKKPIYNFYLEKYRIIKDGNTLVIQWVNLTGEDKFIMFRRPPYSKVWQNKLYFLFHKQYMTDDLSHAYNVLTQVVFSDFCREYGIEADFSEVGSLREASDMVMCSLYKNFFTEIPVDRFINMFGLQNVLSKESLTYISDCCEV